MGWAEDGAVCPRVPRRGSKALQHPPGTLSEPTPAPKTQPRAHKPCHRAPGGGGTRGVLRRGGAVGTTRSDCLSPQFPCRARRRRRKGRRSTCTCTSSSSPSGKAGASWLVPAFARLPAGWAALGGEVGRLSSKLPLPRPVSRETARVFPQNGAKSTGSVSPPPSPWDGMGWGGVRGEVWGDPTDAPSLPAGTTCASGTPPSSTPCTASAGSAPPPPGRALPPPKKTS